MANIVLPTSCKAMAGGVDAVSAINQGVTAVVGGTFALADQYSLILTNGLNAVQTLIGAGNLTGVAPVFAFTYNNKVYLLSGASVYFSAIRDATRFNDPNGTGNGFVTLSNIFGVAENMVAIGLHQGRLVFLGRRTTQVWAVDDDPDQWHQEQVLQNVGTIAGATVQSLGELEMFFLADNGIRSLRARETTLNAFVSDIGSPIDTIVTAKLAASTALQRASASGVVEPSANRYWCFLNDTIYVLSYFQSSQIIAWSTYAPTYEVATSNAPVSSTYAASLCSFTGLTVGAVYRWTKGAHEGNFTCGSDVLTATGYFVAKATTASVAGTTGQGYTGTLALLTQSAFTPQNFVVLNGQVFTRDGDALYAYGGDDGNTYDTAAVQFDTPFLDVQSPAIGKRFAGIDISVEGAWTVSIGTNVNDDSAVTAVYSNNASSYTRGRIPVMRRATHIKLRAVSIGTGYARFSKAINHFQPASEK